MVCTQADGGVGGQLLDAVGQLGSHALQCAVVRLVASVTGIHLHWSEPQLPASDAACLLRLPGTTPSCHHDCHNKRLHGFPDTSRYNQLPNCFWSVPLKHRSNALHRFCGDLKPCLHVTPLCVLPCEACCAASVHITPQQTVTMQESHMSHDTTEQTAHDAACDSTLHALTEHYSYVKTTLGSDKQHNVQRFARCTWLATCHTHLHTVCHKKMRQSVSTQYFGQCRHTC